METNNLHLDSVIAVIDDCLSSFVLDNNLGPILSGLCAMAIVFQFGKVAVQNLLRAGEGFSFEVLKTPVFSIILIVAWPTLANFISDASIGIGQTVVEKQAVITTKNQESYTRIDDLIMQIENKNIEINQSIETENSDMDFGFESLGNDIKSFSDKIGLRFAKMFLSIASVIDAFVYVCFYFISKLWLKFVLFGGAIAFTISILTGGYTNLINWAKTVVNVGLWIPVAGIMMQIINSIMIRVFEKLNTNIDAVADQMSNGMTAVLVLSKFLDTLLLLLAVTIIFVGLKIIMLAKVPAIIGTWISGGGSASSGFAMGFIPIAMAGAAIKSASGSAVSGASSAVKSFKK